MAQVECKYCYKGKVFNPKYDEVHDDQTTNKGMIGREADLYIMRKYSDGAVACSACNGTGFVETEE